MTIREIEWSTYESGTYQPGWVLGYVDTSADLPTAAQIQSAGNVDPLPGSKFILCDSGAEYLLDSAGVWNEINKSPYADVYTKTEVDTLLSAKQDTLTPGVNMDTAPTSGSDNPVTSGGVYSALDKFTTSYVIGEIFEENTAYDLNDYTTPGVWRSRSGAITANISHVPADIQVPNTTRGFRLEVSYVSSNLYVRQIVIPAWNANAADQYYIRHYRSSGSPPQQGWSNWYLYSGTDTGS